MYGKLFASLYDGTLATKGPWQAIVTFQQFIALADAAGHVDMTPEAISRRTTIPLRIIRLGITALEQPDEDSRSPDEEGRRIVRLSDTRDWGWRIVNHEHYRKLRSADERREYMKQYQREHRATKSTSRQQLLTPVNEITDAVSSKQYAVSNKPPIAPLPAKTNGNGGGSKAARLLKAGAFINRIRAIRAYPAGIQHKLFESDFTAKEREIASAAGIETILNTPPTAETSLRWQIAEMLEGVA